MKAIKYISMFAVAYAMMIGISSCGNVERVSDRVAAAETAMAEQNLEFSRHLCDEITGEKRQDDISAGEYARLSILYMHFYEADDDSGALDTAVECYRKAIELNADSARAVYSALPAEEHKYAYALSMIAGGIDNPSDGMSDNDQYVAPDSVGLIPSDSI